MSGNEFEDRIGAALLQAARAQQLLLGIDTSPHTLEPGELRRDYSTVYLATSVYELASEGLRQLLKSITETLEQED